MNIVFSVERSSFDAVPPAISGYRVEQNVVRMPTDWAGIGLNRKNSAARKWDNSILSANITY